MRSVRAAWPVEPRDAGTGLQERTTIIWPPDAMFMVPVLASVYPITGTGARYRIYRTSGRTQHALIVSIFFAMRRYGRQVIMSIAGFKRMQAKSV